MGSGSKSFHQEISYSRWTKKWSRTSFKDGESHQRTEEAKSQSNVCHIRKQNLLKSCGWFQTKPDLRPSQYHSTNQLKFCSIKTSSINFSIYPIYGSIKTRHPLNNILFIMILIIYSMILRLFIFVPMIHIIYLMIVRLIIFVIHFMYLMIVRLIMFVIHFIYPMIVLLLIFVPMYLFLAWSMIIPCSITLVSCSMHRYYQMISVSLLPLLVY